MNSWISNWAKWHNSDISYSSVQIAVVRTFRNLHKRQVVTAQRFVNSKKLVGQWVFVWYYCNNLIPGRSSRRWGFEESLQIVLERNNSCLLSIKPIFFFVNLKTLEQILFVRGLKFVEAGISSRLQNDLPIHIEWACNLSKLNWYHMDEGCIHTTISADIRFVKLPPQHLTQKVNWLHLFVCCVSCQFVNFSFSGKSV